MLFTTKSCIVHDLQRRLIKACVACLQLGTYNPIPSRDGFKEVRLNTERIKYWIAVGAQPSDR